MKDVSTWCEQYQNWKFTRQLILDKYGDPDPTDVIQNLAIVIMSLLYGNNNFEKAILLALNSGYDTDCTCATVGAIIGVVVGANAIPSKWKEPIGDDFKMGWGKSMGEDMYEGLVKHRWILEQWITDLASIPPWVLKLA